mmetsp:Transcript_20385/g.33743  ORF Transcript_20385/g.33743 Transcript_20385/m.33743 type:complete len:223 (-) Transcript_20385:99-767(-)|eukprot:CAMPEP_0119012962 /NCGR_PEP_ID=MMETSP1176-20130426/7721_1 /TAXON_ID=265551 /ORGANISM="Synedropsis recta cf, Strain CCMP1620" /LENGTH=222 /DNA_ID=CAMNT_0006966003 /DNA_START=79 /DNA_END=747 /DNA_ORIENTATION=+
MNAVESITIVFLPLAAFLCVFVAMWWCLLYDKTGGNKKDTPAVKDLEDFRVEIAKTASKEESVGDIASPSLVFEPSVLTEERFDPITEEDERNISPIQKRKAFLSSRWLKTEEEKIEEEDLELGAANSVDNEDLTLENYESANFKTTEDPVRSPTRVIKSFLSRKSVAATASLKKGPVPTEIFSERLAFSDMESHPDDETTGAFDNDNDTNTLASTDVYTLG